VQVLKILRVKVSVAERPPGSVTLTVMVTLPNWPTAGVMVRLRVEEFPEKGKPVCRLASGTIPWSLEVAVTDRSAGWVSGSPTVNVMNFDFGELPGSLQSISWSAMFEIVGGAGVGVAVGVPVAVGVAVAVGVGVGVAGVPVAVAVAVGVTVAVGVGAAVT
jgi:hypothetical protein